MKEIVVISGKGGTGKTSITASFSVLGGKDLVVADCDVDAADMHLLLEPDFGKSEDFYSGELAEIDPDLCIACGKCQEVCRFDAIDIIAGKYHVDPVSCDGCGYCARICPVNAINWYWLTGPPVSDVLWFLLSLERIMLFWLQNLPFPVFMI